VKANRVIGSKSASIFIFGYGLIVQLVAFAIIYFFISNFPIRTSVVEAFVFIWYCIPVMSVFSVMLASVQIKRRISSHEKYKAPLIGLILNLAWLMSYLYLIYLAFEDKAPSLFTK
jgi:hypothetical protein